MPKYLLRAVLSVSALVVLVFAPAVRAQSLVADIGPGTDVSSQPNHFTAFNGRAWFVTRLNGLYQLWSTAGDAATTQQEASFTDPNEVVSIVGATDAHLYLRVRRIPSLPYDNLVQFDPVQGMTLVHSQTSGQLTSWTTSQFAFYRSSLGVVAYDGTTHSSPLSDLSFLLGGRNPYIEFANGRVLHATDVGSFMNNDYRLVVSDGTPAGTNVLPNALNARAIVMFQGEAYVLATDLSATQGSIWRTDGTAAGTTLVQSLGSALPNWFAATAVATDNTLVFSTVTPSAQSGGQATVDLWAFDGTTAQTVTAPGSPILIPNGRCGQRVLCTSVLVDLGGVVTANLGMWLTDGTTNGSFAIGPNSGLLQTMAVGDAQTLLLDSVQRDLWISDGSLTGTSLLLDGTDLPWRVGGAALGGSLVFGWNGTLGDEPWVTDGTPAGTAIIQNIGPTISSTSSTPESLTAFGSSLLFSADDGTHGRELWISHGSAATRLTDIRAGATSSLQATAKLAVVENRAFFIAIDPGGQPRVYTTDGTVAGTQTVSGPRASPEFLTPFDGRMWFRGFTSATGWELWSTDGTAGGTQIFANLAFSTGSSNPRPYFELNGKLLYSTIISGQPQLWATNGTPASQMPLAPVSPASIVRAGNRAFFVEFDNQGNSQNLWVTDGTAAGTSVLHSFSTTLLSADTDHLTVVGDNVFFRAWTAASGAELWHSDGTVAGTSMVVDLHAGSLSGLIDEPMAVADGTVFFHGFTAGSGAELWRSDGTNAGTVLVTDMAPGPASTALSELHAVGSGRHVVLAAPSIALGLEPTISDGTASGTTSFDLRVGLASSAPDQFVTVRDRIYFAADDGVLGRELWALDLASFGSANVVSIAPGCPGTNAQVPQSGTVSQPYLGSAAFALTAANALPNSPALLALANAPALAPVPLGGGCSLHLDLGSANLLLSLTDGAGNLSIPTPLPVTPALQGQAFYFQFLIVDPAGGALGLGAVSDATMLLIGN